MKTTGKAKDAEDFSKLPLPELEKKLDATADGLSEAEAAKRLDRYGANEIPEKTVSPLMKFLSYFWGPIPWMIEIAVVLSAIDGHWPDFFIILLLLFANALVGFFEEHQAGNAIAALKSQLAARARVRRDGDWKDAEARKLVPGDVVHLRLGDIVPADVRILNGKEAELDQSALTGESLPVTRQEGDAAYSGSIIRTGEFDGLVYATGANTYFGHTAQLVQESGGKSHFQRAVQQIGNYLIVLALALVAVIILISLFRGDPLLGTLQFALVLTVAAIPVALPTVLSVTMAVGAKLLADRKAIVSRLAAIEELAGADVLCSDKTGTLTMNKLTLGEPFCLGDIDKEAVILAGALASRADGADAIDTAVLGGLTDPAAAKAYTVKTFKPFDPVSKDTEAELAGPDGAVIRAAKGAPQVIMAMSSLSDAQTADVNTAVDGFAQKGYRSLGVARAEGDGPWTFLGVLPLFDPPRDTAKDTIERARAMGIDVKMVTGDQLAIARETSRVLGLGGNILDAATLGDAKHHEGVRADDAIENADGFAQVFPEHKYHIVSVLQDNDHIVAMTGDGVNDAPALKKADCGIAVSGATDAARSAADMVLTTPGLSVIIEAVDEARKIFQRMNNYAIYRIAETLTVLLFMAASIMIFNFYPMTAVMIVMLALLNDGAILSIAYDNVKGSETPERWNMHRVLGISTLLGLIGPVAAFGLFYIADRIEQMPHDQIQTLMYLFLSVSGHLTVFIARTRGPFWSSRPANILLLAVFGTQLLATMIAVFGLFMTSIPLSWALIVWGYALAWFVVTDGFKVLAYRHLVTPVNSTPG
ncbi:plasma-membrane proton-efflux P-type ATPase [Hoeflea sp. WL0058]|uniref:Plasma-membrane proton-efflux P-type ATPase n=1 Tax=Flavimaribacter sediminis TaxID=2865987 RepID=A0AAE3D1C8_9HYPH|nr:plasma-membrane proton-efflux P-type ATPase [Flavimaribacter sediminis]MBW8639545.1 plasma-membrane proton-efflux P-type ATPase [Flavimaribacter sediminis]